MYRRAYDANEKRDVVIKKLLLTTEDGKGGSLARKLTLIRRELLLLQMLKHRRVCMPLLQTQHYFQLLKLCDAFTPQTQIQEFTEFYHVTEYRGCTLRTFRDRLKVHIW